MPAAEGGSFLVSNEFALLRISRKCVKWLHLKQEGGGDARGCSGGGGDALWWYRDFAFSHRPVHSGLASCSTTVLQNSEQCNGLLHVAARHALKQYHWQ